LGVRDGAYVGHRRGGLGASATASKLQRNRADRKGVQFIATSTRRMVMTRFTALVAVGAATQLAACTAQPGASPASTQAAGGRCFSASQVAGFSPVNDRVVDVEVGANRYYRLELTGFCPFIDRSPRIALRTIGGGSWICSGLDAELIVPDSPMGERCPVVGVRQISREEWLAARRR
jgi:hypothetical protein